MAPLDQMYFARICWNDRNWTEPGGVGAEAETGSFVAENGYGHEEWLFNFSRCIDGWHYAQITSLGRSRNRLLRENVGEVALELWTKDPIAIKRLVGRIDPCEVLTDEMASNAVTEYIKRGWLSEMASQVRELGFDPFLFDSTAPPSYLFNVRFKPEHATIDPSLPTAPSNHPIQRLQRYQLSTVGSGTAVSELPQEPLSASRPDSPIRRSAIPDTVVYREHNAIQNHLRELLSQHAEVSNIIVEQNYIDLQCQIRGRLHLFEIKSDPDAKSAIRSAIGQLLEYAYFSSTNSEDPHLHIVAPAPASRNAVEYLERLQSRFSLRFVYHQVTRETDSIDL